MKALTQKTSHSQWFKLLPDISLRKGNIYCNQFCIPTKNKKKYLDLFSAFLPNQQTPLNKRYLLAFLYGGESKLDGSKRLQKSLDERLYQTISRTRRLAAASTQSGLYDKWIEWFPYCHTRDAYWFYRLENPHVFHHYNLMKRASEREAQNYKSKIDPQIKEWAHLIS